VGGPDHVCRLRKSLYGLKQAGRVWNQTLYSVLSSMGFKRVESRPWALYLLRDDVRILMPVLSMISHLLAKMVPKSTHSFRNCPNTSNCEIWGPPPTPGPRNSQRLPNRSLSISQSQYISNLLQGMVSVTQAPFTPLNPGTRLSTSMCPQNDAEASENAPVSLYLCCRLSVYLAVTTHPDISYAAGVLARFNSNPGLAHWQAAKHVLHYLKGYYAPEAHLQALYLS